MVEPLESVAHPLDRQLERRPADVPNPIDDDRDRALDRIPDREDYRFVEPPRGARDRVPSGLDQRPSDRHDPSRDRADRGLDRVPDREDHRGVEPPRDGGEDVPPDPDDVIDVEEDRRDDDGDDGLNRGPDREDHRFVEPRRPRGDRGPRGLENRDERAHEPIGDAGGGGLDPIPRRDEGREERSREPLGDGRGGVLDPIPRRDEDRDERIHEPVGDGRGGGLNRAPDRFPDLPALLRLREEEDEPSDESGDPGDDEPDRARAHRRVQEPLRGGGGLRPDRHRLLRNVRGDRRDPLPDYAYRRGEHGAGEGRLRESGPERDETHHADDGVVELDRADDPEDQRGDPDEETDERREEPDHGPDRDADRDEDRRERRREHRDQRPDDGDDLTEDRDEPADDRREERAGRLDHRDQRDAERGGDLQHRREDRGEELRDERAEGPDELRHGREDGRERAPEDPGEDLRELTDRGADLGEDRPEDLEDERERGEVLPRLEEDRRERLEAGGDRGDEGRDLAPRDLRDRVLDGEEAVADVEGEVDERVVLLDALGPLRRVEVALSEDRQDPAERLGEERGVPENLLGPGLEERLDPLQERRHGLGGAVDEGGDLVEERADERVDAREERRAESRERRTHVLKRAGRGIAAFERGARHRRHRREELLGPDLAGGAHLIDLGGGDPELLGEERHDRDTHVAELGEDVALDLTRGRDLVEDRAHGRHIDARDRRGVADETEVGLQLLARLEPGGDGRGGGRRRFVHAERGTLHGRERVVHDLRGIAGGVAEALQLRLGVLDRGQAPEALDDRGPEDARDGAPGGDRADLHRLPHAGDETGADAPAGAPGDPPDLRAVELLREVPVEPLHRRDEPEVPDRDRRLRSHYVTLSLFCCAALRAARFRSISWNIAAFASSSVPCSSTSSSNGGGETISGAFRPFWPSSVSAQNSSRSRRSRTISVATVSDQACAPPVAFQTRAPLGS